MTCRPQRRLAALLLAGCAVLGTGHAAETMLIAPAIQGVDACIAAPGGSTSTPARGCAGRNGSAAALVESTLRRLQPTPPKAAGNGFALGYTLTVPLLRLFRAEGAGWSVDDARVQRVVRTVRNNQRPLILYLSSSYFAQQAPIEQALLRQPENLAQTRDGVLPVDSYRGETLYPWTLARTDTPITTRRVQATQALLTALCKLPRQDLEKIQGVSLLGELHQLAPRFETGMGFTPQYRVTDYSAASATGFRRYLQTQFGTVQQLNAAMDASYTSFEQVQPPSRDIRLEPSARYTEHIDSFAQGSLPIAGWAWAPGGHPLWVRVYRNGTLIGRTPVNQGRRDVLQAKPELANPNTGWRMNMDFRQLPAGLHRITALLELAPGTLVPLGTHDIAIMDKHRQVPALQPQRPLPPTVAAPAEVQGHMDLPQERQSFYYNPLVPAWHAFRNQQVADYLRYFDAIVAQSCLKNTPRYTHQMLPGAAPDWDANKFATDATLQAQGNPWPGVDLHGPAIDTAPFPSNRKPHPYGITEFIPLRAMKAPELQAVLQLHAQRGARFLAFFLEPYGQEQRGEPMHSVFSFDPGNPQFGSAQLYEAMRETLHSRQPRIPARQTTLSNE